jgi:hypothetical protein
MTWLVHFSNGDSTTVETDDGAPSIVAAKLASATYDRGRPKHTPVLRVVRA